ncbi:hypothetical protein RvY_11387-1 [Ramazzottius varieornatus]|uniref:Reverse transcriptase domain-containing protein n=1 Tax=Ramazzottius varieornatus TaxID=947166 RepID=A0A1D1VPT2_RAMVA|nr:hypothetical protein RvY_11387-1 [Ramazzottius varieornatus]
MSAVSSFPCDSAGGPNGLRPQHLKDLLGGLRHPMSLQLAQALAALVGLMLDGKVPEDVCPALYGASLIALLKKTGRIRPIAVGNTLRRLAGKIVSKRVMEATGNLVRPQQLGYGTRGGAKTAVHSTRAFHSGQTGCQTLLKLDFRNAFNSAHRDRLLEEAQKFLPEIYPFIFRCTDRQQISSTASTSSLRPGGSTERPPRAIVVLSSDPEPVQVASVALQCMVS